MIKIDRNFILAIITLSVLVITVFVVAMGFGKKSTVTPYLEGDEMLILPQNLNQVYSLPDTLFFAGERMPLENFDTRESLERELIMSAYRHSSTIMIIKKANRYFPIIEPILREYNIPDDFKYLVAAESEFANVISPAGATGFWQIMQATGREEGLEINTVVDERYNLEKSTEFACKYFLKSFEQFGNWTLVAASYNGGRAAVQKQIDIQKQTNYYDLLLSEETARYLFRVAAYKLIINDPKSYGFDIAEKDLYKPLDFREVEVDTAVNDFAEFAEQFGTNYKILKFLNPWLRKPYLTARANKRYIIKVPDGDMRSYTEQ
ncbi:MAG TPA: lytic transglycosylase domain-containing protein [Bacteroidetes bacterium]|nr:lytic transglycosylase domain-containing protein [Bacteroidota bacterium]